MGVFGEFKHIVAVIDFLLLFTFGRSHLLGKITILTILQLHLHLVFSSRTRHTHLSLILPLALLVRVR